MMEFHTPPLQPPWRRTEARRLVACAGVDATARAQLDTLSPDAPGNVVLIERLRFGPPETWLGWRSGVGRVAIKLWPADQAPPPLPPVRHPGIAPLLDQGAGWRLFAWVPGPTLNRALREGMTPPAVAEQVAAALAALHGAGLPHGDVTPANVVVGMDGAVLIDWGEESAGTPGWRPDEPHDALERDLYGLRRLREFISARSADGTP